MKSKDNSRRDFLKKAVVGTSGLAISLSAKSYSNILGANERVNMAVIGLNGRGQAHISAIKSIKRKVSLAAICDVDTNTFQKMIKVFPDGNLHKVKTAVDFRELLDDVAIDAVTIAAPDHWHVSMAIQGMQAGKYVYSEKPLSHNPAEGELLVASQQKEGKILQIGNQQRSSVTSQQAVKDIAAGIIGEPYFAKCWYDNKRGSIGTGKVTAVPDNLNWDLWQGPAPRRDYKDNIVHYNWHWFENWGTGEVNNNGLHELDICRWALNVGIPDKVMSVGGRFHFDDDWEFYDTQKVDYVYGNDKLISWEGLSCHGFDTLNRGRGTLIFGRKGSILLDRNGYWLYDLDGKLVKETLEEGISETTNTVGIGYLDILHFENFLDAIQKDVPVNSPVREAYISTLMCHLGNMAQKLGRPVEMDATKGILKNDPEAQKMWSREFEPGWAPVV